MTGGESKDCRCLSEHTSSRRGTFTPSSLCNHGKRTHLNTNTCTAAHCISLLPSSHLDKHNLYAVKGCKWQAGAHITVCVTCGHKALSVIGRLNSIQLTNKQTLQKKTIVKKT